MRATSVISLLLGIPIFFLPWVDIHCEKDKRKTTSLLTQTGYQAATGEVTLSELLKSKQGEGDAEQGNDLKELKNPKPAPILFGFIGVLAVGSILALVLPRPSWQLATVLCALVALGVLAIQTLDGFAIEKILKQKEAARAKPPAVKAEDDFPKPTMGYMPYYYLAWLFPGVALITALLAGLMGEKPKPSKNPDDESQPDEIGSQNPFDE